MRIVYLSEGYHVYDRRFLEKMVERGHQPILISYYSGEVVQIPSIETLHYDFDTVAPWPRLRLWQAAMHLKRLLGQLRPDVLHTGYLWYHGVIGAKAGFHPTLSMPWGSDVLIEPETSLSRKEMARFTFQQADAITCDCRLVKHKILELTGCSPEKITIFPWGIDLRTFKPANVPSNIREKLGWRDKKILIMTRDFRPIYGIEYFIEALPAIIHKQPEARVIFVSTGPLEEACRQKVTELGLAGHVHFAGAVDETGMTEHLNAADIYVTTSLSDGTSACMLEAMACGLPVVVSDAPVYFEWVEDGVNGYIVPRRDVAQLRKRILELLERPVLRQEMGERNLQIAKKRADWENNFSVLEAIYGRLFIEAKQKEAQSWFFPVRALMQTAISSPRRGIAVGREAVRDWLHLRHSIGSYDDHLRCAMEWLARGSGRYRRRRDFCWLWTLGLGGPIS